MPQDMDSYLQSMRSQDEEAHTQSLAQSYNLPYVNLIGYPLTPNMLAILPQATIEQFGVVPFARLNNKIRLALTNPANQEALAALQQIAKDNNFQFEYAVCSPASLQYALNLVQQANTTPANPAKPATAAQEPSANISNLRTLQEKLAKVSMTSLVDLLFAGAVKIGASDIHIEPAEEGARLRYRIDGVLQEIAVLPLTSYKPLNSRIKYLAGIKLDVKSTPQDGRFTIAAAGESIDVRVATLPASYGEIIDMRLLNSRQKINDLANLGFRPDALKMIEEAIDKPHGLILNTGPTGSGKTTTLYAILSRLNKPGIKIITLEDPIEYRLSGIDQVQIEPERNLTFPAALRASLRQDPNIIMVGEIRDKETAEIALQAAMTGHLVLSTLHTNNAPSALPRLMDMGVEPYLLAGSLNLIIAQRLVRTKCANCQGKGCDICNSTGFKGRIAVIECLKPTSVIDKLIMAKAPVSDFLSKAKEEGMITMEEDGLEKVTQGLTTKEEVWRVTRE